MATNKPLMQTTQRLPTRIYALARSSKPFSRTVPRFKAGDKEATNTSRLPGEPVSPFTKQASGLPSLASQAVASAAVEVSQNAPRNKNASSNTANNKNMDTSTTSSAATFQQNTLQTPQDNSNSSGSLQIQANVASTCASTTTQSGTSSSTTSKTRQSANNSQPQMAILPEGAWDEFEARLEADLQTVGVTLFAIFGVIVFWRGVWTLLDFYLGDNPIGDVCCILAGFGIIMYIRLSGWKVGSFWPSG